MALAGSANLRAVDTLHALWRRRQCEILVSLSLLFSVLIPILGRTRMGDLSDHFGDHLHHAWATDIVFHRGLDIYRRNFADLWPGSTYPQKEEAWGSMARPYPPGVFAVFAPTTLLARVIPMSKSTFGAVSIVYLLLLTHVGFLAMCRLLHRSGPGTRVLSGGLVVGSLVALGLGGVLRPALAELWHRHGQRFAR